MTDVYEVPDEQVPEQTRPENLYQVYDGSRIPISKQVGPYWRRKYEAALKAYESVHATWDEAMRYYNNSQNKSLDTPRGIFKRGDSTENIVFSNVNIMLPATYMKDPDINCATTDEQDAPFCKALKALINTLMRRRDKLNAKHKIRRATGFALLTNSGNLKLSFQRKDDSREWAINEVAALGEALKKAKDEDEVEEIMGKMSALELNMEVFNSSGPSLGTVLPHKLIIDPFAENPDATDAGWMIEEVFENTAMLNARYTKKKRKDGEDQIVLVYKPTHVVQFTNGPGTREDGLGMVMSAMDKSVNVGGHTTEEREAAIQSEYSQCFLVWDKAMRRVMLFHSDDWTWPIWVWDDPYKLQRFFPYFVISFGFSTGSVQSPGEVSYYLDQQDEINDINRQVAKIRRTIFDYFYYNSDKISKDEAEKFISALRGETQNGTHILGVRLGEQGKIAEAIENVMPPSVAAEAFFNKEPILNSINRLTNTSDAIRGVQFKTNTTEDAVQSYQEAAKMAIGAKVDVLEDTVSDLAYALAEMCVQFYSKEDVVGLIGAKLAEGWDETITLQKFRSEYSLTLVAGSMEKPNSVYKKKEAVQVAQAVGQFAQAAPGGAMRVMLKVLEKAFTEVTISPEDWATIDQEIEANLMKGISQSGASPSGGAAPSKAQPDLAATGQGATPPTGQTQGQALSPAAQQIEQIAQSLPQQYKDQIMQAKQQGVPDEQILQFIKQASGGLVQ